MCDIATGIMVAGAIVSTIGGVQQASYQRKAATYAATATQDQARAEESRNRDQARRLLGAQQAAYAGSGVAADSGSPLDVAADSAAQAELDALTIRHGGRVRSDYYRAEAAQAKASIPTTILGGALAAGSAYASRPVTPPGAPGGTSGWLRNFNLDRSY